MRRIGLASACLAVLAGLAINLASDSVTWRVPLWALLGVAVVATWFSVRHSDDPEPDSRDLAEIVREQWETEARIRDLSRPDPLPVRWSTTGRPVSARSVSFRLSGTLDEVVDAFLALPRRQLVILGDPGSGKSVLAVLLTLGLLKRRQLGEPVPVLLSLATWHPGEQRLDGWLASRLAADYPGANATVLPILDGLDELPGPLRPLAIDGIDLAMAGGRPFVVTCRGEEYESAVATGAVLSGAAVVELEPVRPSETITFITARTPAADVRWDAVSAHLNVCPSGDLATVLSSPLMAWLARHAYSDPSTNPAELLDFPNREAIERHLLAAIVPVTYREAEYSPEQATRWLSFLAGHLRSGATHDLAWWRLHLVAGRGFPLWAGVAVGLVVVAAGTLVTMPVAGPFFSLVEGLAFGLPAGLIAGTMYRTKEVPVPSRVGGWDRGLATRLVRRFTRAFLITMGVLVGMIIVTGLLGGLRVPLGTALLNTLRIGPLAGLVVGLSSALYGWFSMPAPVVTAPSPRSELHDDRVALVVQGLAGGFVVTLPIGLLSSFDGWTWGLVTGLTALIAAALVFALGRTASSWYALAHILLALRGKLPWRLMRFLDDAHGRGILRQSGAVYQFRHALLRDHLAGDVRGG